MIVFQILKMVYAFFVEVGLTAILTCVGFIGVTVVIEILAVIIGFIIKVIKKIKEKIKAKKAKQQQ